MPHFTLIGRPTLVFKTTWRGDYFEIPCIKGVTLDGKHQTLARIADVIQTTDREELTRRLRARYDEQVSLYPRTSEIGWPKYLKANLADTIRNDALAWARNGHGALESYRR